MVCGDGGLAGALRAQAERERLDVRWLGQVTPRELAGAYNAATCVVHGCDVETFGIAVAEAIACARPVVAVAGGANPQGLGGNGVLGPADDPAAVCPGVAELLCQSPR